MRDFYYYTLYIQVMNRTPHYTRQVAQIARLQEEHQQQQEQQRILKFLDHEKQRCKHFLEWKSGKNLSKKVLDQYFGNQIVNGKFKDPITLQTIKEDEGILLGNYIFQSQAARNIMGEAREKAISLRIPGDVDEDEFTITLLGTNPQNPLTRQPLSQLDAKLMYHYIYSGTTMPFDEHIDREILTRQTTREYALGKKHRKKTKKYKKKKHKSKKKKNKK